MQNASTAIGQQSKPKVVYMPRLLSGFVQLFCQRQLTQVSSARHKQCGEQWGTILLKMQSLLEL